MVGCGLFVVISCVVLQTVAAKGKDGRVRGVWEQTIMRVRRVSK